jgi:hypothetical protein
MEHKVLDAVKETPNMKEIVGDAIGHHQTVVMDPRKHRYDSKAAFSGRDHFDNMIFTVGEVALIAANCSSRSARMAH